MNVIRQAWRVILWLHVRRRKINSWIVRIVCFYFGYRILRHQAYDVKAAQPLLIFLGLWLCGVPPALFFDGLRKLGADVTGTMEAGITGTVGAAPAPTDPRPRAPDRSDDPPTTSLQPPSE